MLSTPWIVDTNYQHTKVLTGNEMSLLTSMTLPHHLKGPAVTLFCWSQFHYASLQIACSESTGREMDVSVGKYPVMFKEISVYTFLCHPCILMYLHLCFTQLFVHYFTE